MSNRKRWVRLVVTVAAYTLLSGAAFTGAGCTGFWEDTREGITDFFTRPDPIAVVTQEEARPDRRARFLNRLTEPSDPQQRDNVLKLLEHAATRSPYPYERLSAIRSLGRFKDPRAVEILQNAYYQAREFDAVTNNLIKQQALTSLGETGSPAARDLLLRVARAAAEEKDSFEHRLTLDERIAAVRALAHFRDPTVARELLPILRNEKDVALRKRTHQTLQLVTGKNLPDDPEQWEQVIYETPADGPSQTPSVNPIRRLFNWQAN